jgi:hypothetical protein
VAAQSSRTGARFIRIPSSDSSESDLDLDSGLLGLVRELSLWDGCEGLESCTCFCWATRLFGLVSLDGASRFLLVTAAFVSFGSSIWACLPLLRVVAGMLCDGCCVWDTR